MAAVTRSITLDDVTPEELAALFCGMNNFEQAGFFNTVADLAKDWGGSGWCQQSCDIVRSGALTDAGRSAIRSLAIHLQDAEQA